MTWQCIHIINCSFSVEFTQLEFDYTIVYFCGKCFFYNEEKNILMGQILSHVKSFKPKHKLKNVFTRFFRKLSFPHKYTDT